MDSLVCFEFVDGVGVEFNILLGYCLVEKKKNLK